VGPKKPNAPSSSTTTRKNKEPKFIEKLTKKNKKKKKRVSISISMSKNRAKSQWQK
jgi:hypothetical protein